MQNSPGSPSGFLKLKRVFLVRGLHKIAVNYWNKCSTFVRQLTARVVQRIEQKFPKL